MPAGKDDPGGYEPLVLKVRTAAVSAPRLIGGERRTGGFHQIVLFADAPHLANIQSLEAMVFRPDGCYRIADPSRRVESIAPALAFKALLN